MAGENYILHYVNSNAFKNFNQILGTFEDSVEGAYNFSDSRYVSANSEMDHAAGHEAESDPHFTVNSNDSRYVAIVSVKSIIPQKTDDTFAVLSLNIQCIAAKSDSFLGFLSYLDENNILSMPYVCKKHGCLTKEMRRYTTSLVISSYTKGNRAASMAD